jgi:hypothetical protein
VTTLEVYMAMYSTEITVFAALLMGFGLGAWMAYEHGKDKGFVRGYDIGRSIGFEIGREQKFKRDRRGRFIK